MMAGATGQEDRVELMVDINEFYNRTGLIASYLRLIALGFNVEHYGATFRPDRLPDLIEFCESNPEYHILTCMAPGRTVNRYVEGKNLYRLGNGDKNPYLVLNIFVDPARALVAEEMVCSAIAILSDGDAGDK